MSGGEAFRFDRAGVDYYIVLGRQCLPGLESPYLARYHEKGSV